MRLDLKSFLSLKTPIGKKLVQYVYYVMIGVIAVNALCQFIYGIAQIAFGGESVLPGVAKILFCFPLAVVYFLLLRLGCELVEAIFEHCSKS